MNQDNNLAEALKLPNLLSEFEGLSKNIALVGFREFIFSEAQGMTPCRPYAQTCHAIV